ncbi:helix-turn-helix domain-containing protein [Streptomyces lonegramiae]|uniref:Helix-turn-helix domain-containing protein n=1 Tax=Streptomyces lonegramiae TaxID=3075524 RepID=A0ABU2XIL8_9ACTN|nr:helix-turn-helix domain-containing protein [Streptomyces sp. DSM 41529]MDT0544738.1 helix-turn-helix domain-containing protein [Streptomyces sp. DSM 41529]
MNADAHPNELGEFLKARRAELSPRAVGLPDAGVKRRVKGLRREEVALLASISTDYYIRLEQGRRQASAPVLDALARVLHLDDEERAYMLELAGKAAAQPRRQAAQTVQPQLRRLLDELTTSPALILGRRMDILAWNPMVAALLTDFSKIPEKQRNYAWLLFSDPAMKNLHAHWEDIARACVAMLRREAGRNPQDQRMARLVGELSMADDDFRRWWGDHHVASRTRGNKVLRHPVAGDLTLDWDALSCAGDPEQQLVVWTAEPGTPSHDALRLLASWTATTDRSAADR